MRLKLGRDAKLRNERGEVIGEVEIEALDLIITLDGGAAERIASGSEEGSPFVPATTSAVAADVESAQETLALPPSLVAPAPARRANASAVAEDVWAWYCEVMKPRNDELDSETRQIIKSALKVATAQECKDAISACERSDFHMNRPGSGNDRRKFNQVSQILKGKRGGQTTRERIDFFLELGEKAGLQSGVPSGDPGRITSAKQDVRDAQEMPGDVHVAKRGAESEEYLVGLGWRIERDEAGWPTFRPPGGADA